jgi:2-phosphosulfolactate phosphatase
MGNNATVRTDEDELCALHMRNLLEGRPGNPEAVRQVLLAGDEISRFTNTVDPHHPRDLDIALDMDRYDIAIRVRDERGQVIARMTPRLTVV